MAVSGRAASKCYTSEANLKPLSHAALVRGRANLLGADLPWRFVGGGERQRAGLVGFQVQAGSIHF